MARIEQVAAPVDDIALPFEEAPVGFVFRRAVRLRRGQRPEREVIPAAAGVPPERALITAMTAGMDAFNASQET